MLILGIFVAVVVVMSLITFLTYYSDKKRAKKGRWRIKEAVLLALGFFVGAAGALIAMNMLRHKTKHWYFWLVNLLSLALHIAVAIWIVFRFVI